MRMIYRIEFDCLCRNSLNFCFIFCSRSSQVLEKSVFFFAGFCSSGSGGFGFSFATKAGRGGRATFSPNSFGPNIPLVEQEPAYEHTASPWRDRRCRNLWQDAAWVSTTPIHRALLGLKINVSRDIPWKNSIRLFLNSSPGWSGVSAQIPN